MLKLTVKPGEYLLIGDEIRVVFAGGSSNNMRILVDAPKSMNVARSSALERSGMTEAGGGMPKTKYYKERELSPEAQAKIKAIITEERRKVRAGK